MAVSTSQLRAQLEGCLYFTALLTTLVPPTRERSYWLLCALFPSLNRAHAKLFGTVAEVAVCGAFATESVGVRGGRREMQTCFYFGYTAMFCLGLGIMCGAVGFVGSSTFVTRIYRNIKCD